MVKPAILTGSKSDEESEESTMLKFSEDVRFMMLKTLACCLRDSADHIAARPNFAADVEFTFLLAFLNRLYRS